ncbi:MAG TPA: hypothetical protein VMC61_07655 [Methanocella sp.]|nr:hypothetical protein [Methanocella sp.]
MESPYRAILSLIEPYIIESSGVNVFAYPGTKDEFANNLLNAGVESCIPRFALIFKGQSIDLDLLYYIVDVARTTDGGVIFFSPESRILELKMIRRPGGGLDELFTPEHPGYWRPSE